MSPDDYERRTLIFVTKKELFQLLQILRCYYEQFEVNQEKFDAWYRVLRLEEFDTVKKNLENYVKHSLYVPKISDLVRTEGVRTYLVPSSEETKMSLSSEIQTASADVIQTELAKMRQILGIERS